MIDTDSEGYYLDGMAGSTFSMSVKTMSCTEIRKKYSNKAKIVTDESETDNKQQSDKPPQKAGQT